MVCIGSEWWDSYYGGNISLWQWIDHVVGPNIIINRDDCAGEWDVCATS